MAEANETILYRMVLPEHTCPYGVHAKEMLEDAGIDFEDRVLETREQVEAIEEQFSRSTTPVIVIGGEVIGGSEDLEEYLAERA